jgi:undecaprenyl-diphosphatase
VDAVGLLAGLALTRLTVNIAKDAYDRPRPPGSLVDTMLSAYPSGHALQAVTLVACAVVLVRGGVGWAVRIAAVTVARGLVVVVAVTRVYLRAHYLTDVIGGVALGGGPVGAGRHRRAAVHAPRHSLPRLVCSPCGGGSREPPGDA